MRVRPYRLAGFAIGVALVFALPSAARAATLTLVNGTLSYAAGPASINSVNFGGQGGTVGLQRRTWDGDDDPIVSPTPAGCTLDPKASSQAYTCTGVTRVQADAGDGNDLLNATNLKDV